MTTDSIRTLIGQVLSNNPGTYRNQELADLVYESTPPGDIPALYRQALTYVVPVVGAGFRNEKPDLMEETLRPGKKKRGISWKQRGAASWEEKVKNDRLGIPGVGQVPFRHCSIDQFELYAASVIAGGQAQIENGEKYERLAKIGRDRGYSSGEDFPEDVLRDVLG